jgi:hypothetical protein
VSLARPAAAVTRPLENLTGIAARVRDNYLPNLAPSLADLARRRPLAPAVEAGLILGVLTFWNALSAFHGAPSEFSWDEASVAARFKSLGLRGDAVPLAFSVFRERPSEPALRVMGSVPVTRKWFREQLEGSALWDRGVKAKIAPALAHFAMHLERRSKKDFQRAIAATKPFHDFAEKAKGSRGLTPLPASLKRFLTGEDFVLSATHRDSRRRRTLIGFLEFSNMDPWAIPSRNLSRFPSFEAFQWDLEHWCPYNNFHLYFFRSPHRRGENVYRTQKPVFPRFQSEHRGLERTLSDYATPKHGTMGGNSAWIKPVERLFYEAYRRMAALPESRGLSLIS